jgi:hypothetical protein
VRTAMLERSSAAIEQDLMRCCAELERRAGA